MASKLPNNGLDVWVPGQQFEAGIGSFAFRSPFSDATQNFIGGGTEFFATINPTQPPPIYIANLTSLLAGLGDALGELEAEPMTEV